MLHDPNCQSLLTKSLVFYIKKSPHRLTPMALIREFKSPGIII